MRAKQALSSMDGRIDQTGDLTRASCDESSAIVLHSFTSFVFFIRVSKSIHHISSEYGAYVTYYFYLHSTSTTVVNNRLIGASTRLPQYKLFILSSLQGYPIALINSRTLVTLKTFP